MAQRDYTCALNEAIASGVDFDSGFFTQPSSTVTIIVDLAKAHGYRKPRNANGSTGRYFFERLQRQYDKFKIAGDWSQPHKQTESQPSGTKLEGWLMMGLHEFINSNPLEFDSDCSVCNGKSRDSVHFLSAEEHDAGDCSRSTFMAARCLHCQQEARS